MQGVVIMSDCIIINHTHEQSEAENPACRKPRFGKYDMATARVATTIHDRKTLSCIVVAGLAPAMSPCGRHTPLPQPCSRLGLLVLGDEFLLEVSRHLLVLVELRREGAASLGDRAQVGGIVQHFGLGYVGGDLLHPIT